MDTKYTSDGRKVVVIGALNRQEKIVQEIFMKGDIEIPSGENFVVKSLHDEPVKTWKETELEKIELNYEKQKNKYASELECLENNYRKCRDLFKGKSAYLRKLLSNMNDDTFEELNSLLSGDFKYVVEDGYKVKIKRLVDIELSNYDRWNRDLKLITLFGDDEGTMNWRINEYSDGSGSRRKIKFFKTEEEAIEYTKNLINKKDSIIEYDLSLSIKHNFKINNDLIEKYKELKTADLKKAISKQENSLKILRDKLKKMESDFKNIK